MSPRRALAAFGLSVLVGGWLGGCVDDGGVDDGGVAGEPEPLDDDEVGEVLGDDEVGEILDELEAAGFCDPADVDDLGPVTAMHFVVQGRIQPPCYVDVGGDDVAGDARLLEAWRALSDITPTALVSDVSVVAGYECDACDTLAFVSALDEQASFFLLAVDVLATSDPDELLVTMQHELSHVFTQIPSRQLDVGADPESCDTYHNGTGCFVGGSYISEWIDGFWPDDLLDELPPDGRPSSDADADARCLAGPAYAGSYAAVSPEEDFAETFAAFVFDIGLPDAMDEKLDFFDAYPEFTEIRDNAAAAGLGGLEYEFEPCG